MSPKPHRRTFLTGVALLAAALAAFGLPARAQAQDAPDPKFDVIIQGQVVKPGHYTISADFTVIDALDMAGGFTAQALRTSIKVTRAAKLPGEAATTTLDYSDNSLTPTNFTFKLRPGDVVFVPADPTYGK
jgi:protein involved in polysaccharide export with SLBB domain